MADIWQWDDKNSKQSLIPKKRPKLWFSSFAVHFVVNLELAPQKVISAHRNVFQTKKHPSCTTKMQNIAEIENIPLFLPVVYIYIYVCVCVCVCVYVSSPAMILCKMGLLLTSCRIDLNIALCFNTLELLIMKLTIFKTKLIKLEIKHNWCFSQTLITTKGTRLGLSRDIYYDRH